MAVADAINGNVNPVYVDYNLFKEKINVFPNPALHTVFVEMPENVDCICDIMLTDVSGKKLIAINNNGNKKITIDVSQYPAGMYFLSITNKHFKLTEKIIKR